MPPYPGLPRPYVKKISKYIPDTMEMSLLSLLENFIYLKKSSKKYLLTERKFHMRRLDEKDLEMLAILQEDGRLSNTGLADRLAISETPCWRRLKRLVDEKIVTGFQAILNRRKLGLGVMSFVQLSCGQHDPEITRAFEKTILDCPQVLACHNTTGEADFLLQVVARDLDDYSRFVDTVLRRLPGVTRIRSNISLRELKSSNRLPLDRESQKT